jgi:nitroreductase
VDVLEAIKTRRSIRKYKDTPVDDKVLEQVLESARWSPSWANTQTWRFVVVRDKDIKAKLIETLSANNPARNNIAMAPIIIVACAEQKKAGYYRGEASTTRGDWFMFDVGLAMENLVLAAHALGLGTVHVGAFDHQQAESILELPEGFCVVEMTPLGYPEGEARVTPRKELAEIVFKDKFGAR